MHWQTVANIDSPKWTSVLNCIGMVIHQKPRTQRYNIANLLLWCWLLTTVRNKVYVFPISSTGAMHGPRWQSHSAAHNPQSLNVSCVSALCQIKANDCRLLFQNSWCHYYIHNVPSMQYQNFITMLDIVDTSEVLEYIADSWKIRLFQHSL